MYKLLSKDATVQNQSQLELVYLPEGQILHISPKGLQAGHDAPGIMYNVCSQLKKIVEVLCSFMGYLMLPKHFRWTVVQSVPTCISSPDGVEEIATDVMYRSYTLKVMAMVRNVRFGSFSHNFQY